jgi:ABC-type antimicrobial peptide transport system permease subunit
MKMGNNNIVFKVTKAHMKMNRKRTLVTFLGIFVMVVLMTAVFIGKDTVMEFMKSAVAAEKGKWHMQVYDVNKEVTDRIAALRSVKSIEVSRGLGYTEFDRSANPATPFLEIKAYSENLFDLMNISVIEGRYPENDNEIIISRRAIKDGADIKVGDTVTVETFDRYMHAFESEKDRENIAEGKAPGFILFSDGFKIDHGETALLPDHFPYYENNDEFEILHKPTGLKKTMTVVGIMESPFYETKGQGGYMALTRGENTVGENDIVNLVVMENLNTREDPYEAVLQIIDDFRTEEEREEALKQGRIFLTSDGRRIPLENDRVKSNEMLLAFAAKGRDGSINFLMIFIQAFLIVLITAASLILIYNVFSISYKERSRYLGMLSSVGATRKQKRWSVYYEVFTLLIFALPLGIGIGILGVKIAMMLLYPHFSEILNMLVANVIAEKSYEIGYRIIVNPLNILYVIVASAAAVWLSAWLPALKISKVGPVESIRGNDDTAKNGAKGCRTNFRLMAGGKAETLLAVASVRRNVHATRGIIRSISAFITLTLITAFAVSSFSDILTSKVESESLSLGSRFKEMDYVFESYDEETYDKVKEEVENSDEVLKSIQLEYDLYEYKIPMEEHSEEYRKTLETVIGKFYPDGYPEWVKNMILEPEEVLAYPSAAIITLTEEEFKRVADKAGVKITDEHAVLAYDSVYINTDQYSRSFGSGIVPDFASYVVKEPLKVKKGDKLELCSTGTDKETETYIEFKVPVTFAGYVKKDDIEDIFTLRGEYVWIIMREDTLKYIKAQCDGAVDMGIGSRMLFFSTEPGATEIVRSLSQIKNEYGDSCLYPASLLTGVGDLKRALVPMMHIVSVCFTLLMGVICLLNLYNSVMGRRLARQRELAVLDSMGMTAAQRSRMLLTENIWLLVKSFLYSCFITTAFVVCLHKILNGRFGRISFTIPASVVIITVVLSIVGLISFTALCYGKDREKMVIEEVRSETA